MLVLRDSKTGARSIEVYCVQRHGRSPFLGGAIVFPGGKLDEADREAALAESARVSPRLLELGHPTPEALLVAAARELLEEAAMLPAPVDHTRALSLRAELAGGASLGAALASAGIRLQLGDLVPFARWVTPEAESRRFDARFFLLRCPEGQEGAPDARETTLGFWAPPREVLRRFLAGDVQLAPPTTRSLELLSNVETVEDALELGARQDLRPVCPRFFNADPPFLALPGDPAHEVRERIVHGPTRFVLRDGKLLSEDAPPGEPAQ